MKRISIMYEDVIFLHIVALIHHGTLAICSTVDVKNPAL